MKKLIIILFALVPFLGAAQNAQLGQDLAAINHAYFDLKMKMSVSTKAISGDKEITNDYVAYMNGIDHYYMKSEGTEMLVTSTVKVVLNKAMNSVMIDSNQLNTTADLPVEMFDTMTKLYSSVRHTVLPGGFERYELTPAISDVERIVIEFNTNTKLLRAMEMSSVDQSGNRASLKMNYVYSKLVESDIPKITKYVAFDNRGIASLSASYKSFKLINFLNR